MNSWRSLPLVLLMGVALIAAKATSGPTSSEPRVIVTFGDSTTAIRQTVEQVYAQRLPALLAEVGIEAEVINSGVGGSHTGRLRDNANHRRRHALDRLDQAVREHAPDVVIIQFGINDSWVDSDDANGNSRIPREDYQRNLTTIVTTLRGDGCTVLLMTPNRLGHKHEPWRHARLAQYAETVREVAAQQSVELVDVWRQFGRYANQPGKNVDELLLDGSHPNDAGHEVVANLLAQRINQIEVNGQIAPRGHRGPAASVSEAWSIPLVDLSADASRQVVVDREQRQYLGHVSTVLLEDGRTMYAVYPKGHGRGAIVMKRSDDGGLTWSERLPTPASWASSKEVPTIHRVVDAEGKKRLIMWSGLFPARLATSEDDGATWSELKPVGDWGGIVVMGFVERLNRPGHYFAMFHDDGRFFRGGTGKAYGVPAGKRTDTMRLFKTFSADGGLTWSFPEEVFSSSEIHLCEPGCIRSPDGNQLAVVLRENRRRKNSHVIFSDDEGQTWTQPRELPKALTGDRHTCRYAPDGRLVVTFRDRSTAGGTGADQDVDKLGKGSRTEGDWVAWVGAYNDLLQGAEGQYRLRLMDNKKGWDTCYPGLELLPNGTFVATTYGHWEVGAEPYIVSIRFKLEEIDVLAKQQ